MTKANEGGREVGMGTGLVLGIGLGAAAAFGLDAAGTLPPLPSPPSVAAPVVATAPQAVPRLGRSVARGPEAEAPDVDVLRAFVQSCGNGRPDMDAILRRADDMGLDGRLATARRTRDGATSVRKAWTGQGVAGNFGIFTEVKAGSGKDGTACAVAADVSDPEGFRRSVESALHLAAVPAAAAGTGGRSFTWRDGMGRGTVLRMRDMAPNGSRAVMLTLVSGDAAKRLSKGTF